MKWNIEKYNINKYYNNLYIVYKYYIYTQTHTDTKLRGLFHPDWVYFALSLLIHSYLPNK